MRLSARQTVTKSVLRKKKFKRNKILEFYPYPASKQVGYSSPASSSHFLSAWHTFFMHLCGDGQSLEVLHDFLVVGAECS